MTMGGGTGGRPPDGAAPATLAGLGRAARAKWTALTGGSVNRLVLGATVTVGVATVAASLLTLVKDQLVASVFGIGDELDAFVMAFLVPTFAIGVIGGSIMAALVPTYAQVRERDGAAAAQRLLASVSVIALGLLTAVAVAVAAGFWYVLPVFATGFSPAKIRLTRELLVLLTPVLVLSGLALLWTAVLNAGRRFLEGALSPGVIPVAIIAVLLALGRVWGIHAVAVGLLVGAVAQCVILGWALRSRGISLRPAWHGLSPEVREVVRQYWPMVAGSCAMASTTVVDQVMASWLGAGSVAALNYGNKLVTFAVNLGAMSLGTAVFPYFAQMVAREDWLGVRHTLRTFSRWILLATVVGVAVAIPLSDEIVRLLFERGAFSPEDTALVSRVQALLLLQVPFYAAGILYVRLISSIKRNAILSWGAGLSLVINVALNLPLMRWLGVAGIALSTSLVYAISCGYLWIMLQRDLGRLEQGGPRRATTG